MAALVERWVEVAVVGRPHGIRGEIYVRPLNPETTLLTVGRTLATANTDRGVGGIESGDSRRELTLDRVQRTGQGWLVKFRGVDQREVAAALTNQKLFVKRSELPALDPTELYQSDLVGAQVVDPTGRVLGVVQGFFSTLAHEVCVFETPAGIEVLAPFHDQTLVNFDAEAQRLTLDLPEGLPGLDDSPDEPDDKEPEATELEEEG